MKVNTCPRPGCDHFPLPRRAKDEPPAAPPSHLNAARAEKSRFFRSLHVTQEIIQKGKEKNAVPLLVIFIYYHLPAHICVCPDFYFLIASNVNSQWAERARESIIYLLNHIYVCALFALARAQ
jgi:hypothetical protein